MNDTTATTEHQSIYTVAREAGVSVATVSRVINNRAGVKPRTVGAVRAAMAKIGYEPQPPNRRRGPRLNRPRERRKRRVALLIYGISRGQLRAPVYAEVLQGIETALADHGFGLMLSYIDGLHQLRSAMLKREVDGVIIFGRIKEIMESGSLGALPCVRVMGTSDMLEGCDHVTYNNRVIGELAARYLLDRGHTCCAHISTPAQARHEYRGADFASVMKRAGGDAILLTDPDLIEATAQYNRVNRSSLEALVRTMADSPVRPTGLFVNSDLLAAAVYPILVEQGIHPGRDIDVVSCNNEEILVSSLHPRPAEIDIHATAIGRRGVDQLLWRLTNRNARVERILIEPTLVAGG